MPAEIRSARTAPAGCGTSERRPSCLENRVPGASSGELRYCGRCKTFRAMVVAVTRVVVQAQKGKPVEIITTRTCSCRSCGSFILGSNPGSTLVVCGGRRGQPTAAMRRGRP